MIHLILLLLFIGCAVALIWWGINSLAIPQPIKVIILCVLGLVALLVLWQATSGLSGFG